MGDRTRRASRAAVVAAVAAAALVMAAPARAQFLEPGVTVLRTHTAESPGDQFGWVGEVVGDTNGDGVAEYIIGAPSNTAGGQDAGRAYLYNGADGSLLDIVTGAPFDEIGFAVAGPGDVDGDGVPDYATAGASTSGVNAGRLIVRSGADHSVILDVTGPAVGSYFGYDMNGAGDVNGDGHADIVVGAPLDQTSGTGVGSITIISGADGSTLWKVNDTGSSLFLGTGVSGVGDQNGDGAPDVAAAALRGGSKFVGEAYVYSGLDGSQLKVLKPKLQTAGQFGSFFVQNAGDSNGDGVPDIYIGDFADSTVGPGAGAGYIFDSGNPGARHIIYGQAAGDGFGMGRGAGDVDGDGFDDFITGAYRESSAAHLAGKCYLWSGRNKKLIRTMTGTVAGHELGFDVATLGDVNGDGLSDFLITGVDVAHVVAGNP